MGFTPQKYLRLIFLFLLTTSSITAQDSTVSKLSAETLNNFTHILFSINWKYNPWDDLKWADPEFNDSSWVNSSILMGHDDSTFSNFGGTAWFRKWIVIDSQLVDKDLSVRIFQAGASQIFINGKLFWEQGRFSKDPQNEKRFAGREPMPVKFDSVGPHLFAVRYSNHNFEEYFENDRWAGIKFYLGRYSDHLDVFVNYNIETYTMRTFLITVPLLLAILHFAIFLFDRKNMHNLLYVLFLLSFALYVDRSIMPRFVESFDDSIVWYRIGFLSLNVTIMLASISIWAIVDKLPKFTWIFVLLAIVTGLIGYVFPDDASAYLSYAYITLISAITGRKIFGPTDVDSRIKSIVITGFILMSIAGILQMFIALDLIESVFGLRAIYFYGVIGFLIFMSIALAREFTLTTETLKNKLVELEALSEKTLQQEREAKEREIEKKLLEADNERKTVELEEARELQLSMLPKKVPVYPGLEIGVYVKTATEVGGDYYDFNKSRQNILNVVLGDATGHGIKAGIMVANIKSLFAALGANLMIPDFFNRCTEIIKDMGLGNLFMSLSFLRIQNNTVILSCAGMPPVLYFNKTKNKVEELLLKGMPLGGFKNFPYVTEQFDLSVGDLLLIMSDGLMESFNAKKEMFDIERISEILLKNKDRSPDQIINELVEAGVDWRGDAPLDDDVTLMIIKKTE